MADVIARFFLLAESFALRSIPEGKVAGSVAKVGPRVRVFVVPQRLRFEYLVLGHSALSIELHLTSGIVVLRRVRPFIVCVRELRGQRDCRPVEQGTNRLRILLKQIGWNRDLFQFLLLGRHFERLVHLRLVYS